MKNLIKTLVCAVLVLSVVSCRSNDDEPFESVNPVQNSGKVKSTPNSLNHINYKIVVDNSQSEPVFTYKPYSITRRFSAESTETDKIVKINYNISFKYSVAGSEKTFTHEHVEKTPKLSSVTYRDTDRHTEDIKALPLQNGGKEIKNFYDGKILVTITTESGARYSNYLDNVIINNPYEHH